MDSGQFTEFSRDIIPGLLRYITRRTDTDVAEDLCAETLTTLWSKKLPAPHDDASLAQARSLTYRIADGHIANHRRSRRRHLKLVSSAAAHAPREAARRDFVDAIADRERAEQMLVPLDPADQQVLVLIIDGFSFAEIGAILDCSPSAAKMRAFRARKRLRSVLCGQAAQDQSEELNHADRETR